MLKIEINIDPLAKFAARLQHAKRMMPDKLDQLVMAAGPEALSQMKRVLPAQTGLKFKTVNKALKGRGKRQRYEIISRGGDIRLKFFAPRETQKGVSAAPWNKRQIYPGTFMYAGWKFPRSKPVRGAGNVWQRDGRSKYPIRAPRSGLYIAKEMIEGQSALVFYGTVEARIGPAIEKILFAAI